MSKITETNSSQQPPRENTLGYFIQTEIENLRSLLESLEQSSSSCSLAFSGMPLSHGLHASDHLYKILGSLTQEL